MSENLVNPQAIVKEGWLYKRGEHIKNWRSRYFVLLEDGKLLGYKSKPENTAPSEKLNNFTVRGCQIMSVDRPKPYTFIIRGLQWTHVIERTFHVESDRERQQWVEAIRHVANRLSEMGETAMSPSTNNDMTDVDMACIAEDELSEKFSVQGTSTMKSSGKKKVVSIFIFITLTHLYCIYLLRINRKITILKIIFCCSVCKKQFHEILSHNYILSICKKIYYLFVRSIMLFLVVKCL